MKRIWILGILSCCFIGVTSAQNDATNVKSRVDGTQAPTGQLGQGSGVRVKMDPQLEPLGPIRLSLGENQIDLRDFVVDYKTVRTASFDGVNVPIKDRLLFIPAPTLGALHDLTLLVNGEEWSIPVFKSNKSKVVFEYKASSDKVKSVCWAGSLNGWNKTSHPLQKDKSGVWKLSMEVENGEYPYRIWEDGEEKLDANNPTQKDNGLGGKNSVWIVGTPQKPAKIRTFMSEGSTMYLLAEGKVDRYVYYLNNKKGGEGKVEGGKFTIPLPKTGWSGYLRVYAESNGQLLNDIMVPFMNGSPVMTPQFLPRQDPRGQIMYFMMVDRFFDGSPTNNFPTLDPAIQPKANTMGGDLLGISQKINQNYFSQLGVNTLWISPICKNVEGAWGLWDKGTKSKFSAYHGYWPLALTKVDKRFGTEQDFSNLINHAHNKEMNLIVDYVAHHVHQEHPLVKGKKGWTTPLYLPDGTMNTERWDDHRLTTWFDTFLPTFDFSKPEVVNALSDTALYWVKKYDIDGFRHDATKHIQTEFWRELTYKIKKEKQNKPMFQIGETYGSPALIQSYLGSGLLNAQFDFNLYDAMVDAFAKNETNFKNLEQVMLESMRYYGSHHSMGVITGNQDRGRFTSYADGSLKFDEDAKLAGWTREIKNQGSIGYRRMEQLMAFIMTSPGVPCIYYGDEIAMPGGNDPDNRRMMTFDNLTIDQRKLKASVSRMTTLRKKSMALMYGETEILLNTGQTFAYMRQYFGDVVVVVFDKKDFSDNDSNWVEINLPVQWQGRFFKGQMGSRWKKENGKNFVLLSGKGYDIFTEVSMTEFQRNQDKMNKGEMTPKEQMLQPRQPSNPGGKPKSKGSKKE
jgi:glycosidase